VFLDGGAAVRIRTVTGGGRLLLHRPDRRPDDAEDLPGQPGPLLGDQPIGEHRRVGSLEGGGLGRSEGRPRGAAADQQAHRPNHAKQDGDEEQRRDREPVPPRHRHGQRQGGCGAGRVAAEPAQAERDREGGDGAGRALLRDAERLQHHLRPGHERTRQEGQLPAQQRGERVERRHHRDRPRIRHQERHRPGAGGERHQHLDPARARPPHGAER
jgi:hypothetical protein